MGDGPKKGVVEDVPRERFLSGAFSLAIDCRRLITKPSIPGLWEDNVRTGFRERDQFDFEARCRARQPRGAVCLHCSLADFERGPCSGVNWIFK